jgi:hypothetical protein
MDPNGTGEVPNEHGNEPSEVHKTVFLNGRALVLYKKNLPGRGLTKVENQWYKMRISFCLA